MYASGRAFIDDISHAGMRRRANTHGRSLMKSVLIALSATLLMLGAISDAQAVVCANGVRGAGCAGVNGAVAVPKGPVVVRPPVAAPRAPVVVAPKPHCAMVNGRTVCR